MFTSFDFPPNATKEESSLIAAAFTMCFWGNEGRREPFGAFQSLPVKSALAVATSVAPLFTRADQTAPYTVKQQKRKRELRAQ